jgi:hypothetical protein
VIIMSKLSEMCAVTLQKHLAYCTKNSWSGEDPYDALNSEFFRALPFLNHRIPRLLLTQVVKRSPINVRKLLRIPKTQNPKALALFLAALVKLSKNEVTDRDDSMELLINRLIALRSPGIQYWCWGYSFPWQGRSAFVPRGAPNLVCTYFVASSLLDVYELRRDSRCLDMAVSAAEYILNELYWTAGPVASFSYPLPSLPRQVCSYSANLLAADLLCRVHKYTSEEKFSIPALRAARYAAGKQRADGSWEYGEGPSRQWIDSFHTGYNLCALQEIARYAGTTEFDSRIRNGLAYYKSRFFREDGAVKYFHNRAYPIDAHCVAQAIITLVAFEDLDPGNILLAQSVFEWAMSHLWDDRGFFYYRVHRSYTIRTSYMRWTQAWMFLAMAMLLCDSGLAFNAHQGGTRVNDEF